MGLYAAPRLLPAGDGAVSVELGRRDLARGERARADARAPAPGRAAAGAGRHGAHVPVAPRPVRSARPAVDRRCERGSVELSGRLADAPPPPGRRVELPCAYGGAHGPDLEEVARRLDLTPAEVVAPPRGRRALRLLRRLHARAAVHGRAAGAADHPAARPPAHEDARPAASRSAGRRPPSTRSRAPAASGSSAGPRSASTIPARPSRSSSAPATASASGRSTRPSTTRSPRRWRPATYRPRIEAEAMRSR